MTTEDTAGGTPESPEGHALERGPIEVDIDAVAQLAWIELSDDERALVAAQLADVLSHVRVLDELEPAETDSDEVPLDIGLVNVLRPDRPRPSQRAKLSSHQTGEHALASAPQREGQFFATPRVHD